MILVDSSAWIDWLRRTGTPAATFVREHVGIDAGLCEPVQLEVLAGSRPGAMTARIERLLASQQWCGIDPALDYRHAVGVFQATRSSGHPPRSLQDCLIAAVALRHDVALAHRNADFEHIAAVTGLTTIDLRER